MDVLANFDQLCLNFSQPWYWLQPELNVLSLVYSLQSGHFLGHFLVGHLQEVDFVQRVIIVGNPFGRFFLLFVLSLPFLRLGL